jgi:hypothetical protein
MVDQVARRWFIHWACAASLVLLPAACSTAEQAASTGTDQAGFVPSATTEKSAGPPIVTAGDLNQQKAAPDPVAPKARYRRCQINPI